MLIHSRQTSRRIPICQTGRDPHHFNLFSNPASMPTSFDNKPEKILSGTPVSGGVAQGIVRLSGGSNEVPELRQITADDVDAELKRFQNALDGARKELQTLVDDLGGETEKNARQILEMHVMVLDDPHVNLQVEARIKEQLDSAETAYYRIVREFIDAFHRMPDAYLRERALDIKDVAQRVLRHLRGEAETRNQSNTPFICVAHDLTPGETVHMKRDQVMGFAVELGSKTSHTAIMARSLGLPAVVRLHRLFEELHNGDEVILDGDEGLVIINPNEKTRTFYRARERDAERREARLLAESAEPAITQDGMRITVAANAEFIREMPHVRECGAEGIGLFRTEFIHLENPDVTENELSDIYLRIVEGAAPNTVIFRTLDLGGDKLDPDRDEVEQNPFLGWRGIRVSLAKPDLFKRQLRAILRAGAQGPVGIMYPMISGVHEVVESNRILAECRAELLAEHIPIPERVQVGAMIEIPSAAVIAELLAPHVDFFSIGTNDLTQYTLAVDRVNERVADLYQPSHPAVLRLIKMVVTAAHHAGIWAGLCGEMAGDISLTPLLVGLGLDELSAATSQVAKIKHAIRKLDTVQCQQLVEQALLESDFAEIQRLSQEFATRHYAELFEV